MFNEDNAFFIRLQQSGIIKNRLGPMFFVIKNKGRSFVSKDGWQKDHRKAWPFSIDDARKELRRYQDSDSLHNFGVIIVLSTPAGEIALDDRLLKGL